MVYKTVTEERSYYYEFCNNLPLSMSIMYNFCGLVDTYFTMMK